MAVTATVTTAESSLMYVASRWVSSARISAGVQIAHERDSDGAVGPHDRLARKIGVAPHGDAEDVRGPDDELLLPRIRLGGVVVGAVGVRAARDQGPGQRQQPNRPTVHGHE